MRSIWFLMVVLVLFSLFGCEGGNVPLSTPSPSVITDVHPTCGSPGETVVIKGTGFGDTQGSSVVTINGVPAVITSWSDTQIEALVPTTTTGDIVVTVNGLPSNGVEFAIPCDEPDAYLQRV